MTWEEMIHKRRTKESEFVGLVEETIEGFQYYEWQNLVDPILNHLEMEAIRLRHIEPRPIGRVADAMRMSWDGADELIDRATEKVRNFFKHFNQGPGLSGAAS